MDACPGPMPAEPGPSPAVAAAVGLVAVVLTGGRATRLGGTGKAGLELDGRTLLDRALDAVADAGEVVVVGDPEPTPRRVRFTVEEPRYGGPVAAIRAGLDALPLPAAEGAARVVVLAVDMPHVTRETVRRLGAAVAAHRAGGADGPGGAGGADGPGGPAVPVGEEVPDGAVLVGDDGRRQLALVLRGAALAGALPLAAEASGMPLHRVLAGLRLVEVASEGREARDVDTWDDLRSLGGAGVPPPGR